MYWNDTEKNWNGQFISAAVRHITKITNGRCDNGVSVHLHKCSTVHLHVGVAHGFGACLRATEIQNLPALPDDPLAAAETVFLAAAEKEDCAKSRLRINRRMPIWSETPDCTTSR